MSLDDCGSALVLIYGDGRLESSLIHPKDGGEPYMGPLLRKAVQYAKTHYDSGNMLEVLKAEGEMLQVDAASVAEECAKAKVRHVYYVSYRWNAETSSKTYRVSAVHLKRGAEGVVDVPGHIGASGAPDASVRIV